MSEKIFGQRLRQARRAVGLSLRGLADRVGLSHAAIQKFERGDLFPSSDCLIKLSEVLNIRVERLFRPQTVKIERIRYRKKGSLGKKSKEEIEQQLLEKLERRVELENCFPFPVFVAFDGPGFKSSSDGDLEAAAVKRREDWGLGLAPIHDLIDVFEGHGIRVVQIETDDEAFDGQFFLSGQDPVIVISNNWPGDRQRFTLAHELGHLLFHPAKKLDEERVCDRFAGAFLFPKAAVQKEFGEKRSSIELRELLLAKQEYGLSMAAVLYRLVQSKVISESHFKSWKSHFKKEGWRFREPGHQLPPETAHHFEQMVFHALGEEYISESKAAELLNVRLDVFREFRLINEQTFTDR